MACPNESSSADVTSAYRLPTAEKYVGVTKNLNVAGTKPVNYISFVTTQNDVAIYYYLLSCIQLTNFIKIKKRVVEIWCLSLHLPGLSYLYPTGWVLEF